ncbi:MAG: hypothetical protein JNJ57_09975 [Saprospiraceae bacterium]|nr:hypothetical protein [Saprospiraceae bacterium]
MFEYKIFPTLAENIYQNLGINFDVTRRRKSRKLECAYGSTPVSGAFNDPFPVLSDEANDDNNANYYDEDNIPSDGYIYSWDAPGIPLYKQDGSIDSDWAFKCVKSTFEEFVRVGIWNGIPNSNANGLFGSRSSEKTPWHSVFYLKSASDLLLESDGSTASFSGIKEKGGAANGNAGNGTCSIELKGSPISMGYTLKYFSGKWDFNGTEVVENPPGKWIYDNGNNIKITIAKGSVPFYNDDKFVFSVFVSSNKLNSTAISAFQGVESNF